jgi:hypothetical protein
LKLTEDQILALAPDEASKKAGRDLAVPAKWVSKGINELALWGECQGSGSKPYQTQVDLSSIAFKCSCPSRKFPCKHGLGLLLLHARQPGTFAVAESPAWVSDWINKRSEKEEKKTEKVEKPVDENAQAKRQQAREQKVSAGVKELLVWIKDIVRNGILTAPEKGVSYWENMSRRMVDSQASGLSAMVKNLGATNFWKEGWQSDFMDRLISLYLVAEGYQNITKLDPVLQEDIRSAVGFTVSQEELKLKQGVQDSWLVLGKDIREEGPLTIEQNWLYGTKANRFALILQFYARGQFPPLAFTPGLVLNAELVYFPSVLPYRAIVKNQPATAIANWTDLHTSAGWEQVAVDEAGSNSRLPFRSEMPIILGGTKLVSYQKQWWLQDKNGCLCKLEADPKQIWKLLAVSGGEALTLALIGRENTYRPIGLWHQNNYTTI